MGKMRKITSLFLVLAYLHCIIGCTHWVSKQAPEIVENANDLRIQTLDSMQYLFESNSLINNWYSFKKDTLYGVGYKLLLDTIPTHYGYTTKLHKKNPEYIEIAINEIKNLDIKETSILLTVLAIALPITIITWLALTGYFDLTFSR
jgi:hypothetical protein